MSTNSMRCVCAFMCIGAEEQGAAVSFTHAPLTLQRTEAALAQSGTAFLSLFYCPILCLLCCIYRPFTAHIYWERSQSRKHE